MEGSSGVGPHVGVHAASAGVAVKTTIGFWFTSPNEMMIRNIEYTPRNKSNAVTGRWAP